MTSSFSLTSSVFAEGASIPAKYTCDEQQPSPPLAISGAPTGTKSFALIMDDPDVPKQVRPEGNFLHWVVFNISADTTQIAEGASIGVPGQNGRGKTGYVGPCPPPNYEPSEHRYFFVLYALDTELALSAGASKADVIKAMQEHVLGEAQLMGRYRRR